MKSWLLQLLNSADIKQCVCPNGHSFFYSEIRNFTVALKQPAICFFTAKYEILQLHPNGYSFFIAQCQSLQLYLNDHMFFFVFFFLFFFTAKYKILKTVPKRPYVLSLRNTRNLKLHQNSFRFWITKYKIWNCTQTDIRFFDYKQRK